MKSKRILKSAPECFKKLDGVETLLQSCEQPLDLSLKKYQTNELALQSGTDNSVLNKPQQSKIDVEVSEPFQPHTSMIYETGNKIDSMRTSQSAAQQGISVIRPTPIYCCRAEKTTNRCSGNFPGVSGIPSGHNCLSKTIFQATYPTESDSSNNASYMSNALHTQRWNRGTSVPQAIVGIFKRRSNHNLMTRADKWNVGPKLAREVITDINKSDDFGLMKFQHGGINRKSPDKFVTVGNVPDGNMEVAADLDRQYKESQRGKLPVYRMNSSFGMDQGHYVYSKEPLDIYGAGTLDKELPDHVTCSQIPRTDTLSENDNSFEALFEYLSSRDEQNSSERETFTEGREHNLPVLQGCEDIVDLQSELERFDEGREILELVEPSISSSIDFMEGCRLSPFSVFNQSSYISKYPDPVLNLASFNSSKDEEVDEGKTTFSPETISPIATVYVFPFQEESADNSTVPRSALSFEFSNVLNSELSLDQQHKVQKAILTAAGCDENPVLDLSTKTMSLPILHRDSENKLEGMPEHNPRKVNWHPKKSTAISCLNKISMETVVSSELESTVSTTKSTPMISQGEFQLSSPTESETGFSNKETSLPSLHKESTLLYERESILTSLFEESARLFRRESDLPTVHRESTTESTAAKSVVLSSQGEITLSSPRKEPTLGRSREPTVPLLHKKSKRESTERESLLTFSSRGSLSNRRDGDLLELMQSKDVKSDSSKDLKSNSSKDWKCESPKDYKGKSSKHLKGEFSKDFKDEPTSALSKTSKYKMNRLQDTSDTSSAFVNDFERAMEKLSTFSSNLEKSGQGISQKMTSVEENSPTEYSENLDYCMPKSQTCFSSPSLTFLTTVSRSPSTSDSITSPVLNIQVLPSLSNSPIISGPNSPMITGMPNSPSLISTPNLPSHTSMANPCRITSISDSQNLVSPLPNSTSETSVPNLYIPTSSKSNANIFKSQQNSPLFSSPSRLEFPSMQTLTSSVVNSSLISPIAKLPNSSSPITYTKNQATTSVSNSTTTAGVVSPCSSGEKGKQYGTSLSPPMKHKQMLIEKYKMSVNPKMSGGEPKMKEYVIDSSGSKKSRKAANQQLFQTCERVSISESEKVGNFCFTAKKRKLLIEESKDTCESNSSNRVQQPEDLEPCETFYWCHVCEKTVKCEKDANRHLSIHGYNVKANLIFYYLQVYGSVTLHWRGYNKEEKCVYLCGLCDRTIPYLSGFKRHIQTHGHNILCEVCNKYFDNNESFLEHKFSHSEPNSCAEETDQPTTSRTPKHSNPRNGCSATNKCRFCGKFFSSRSSLTIHMRLHTGQNPYKCQLCDRSYPQNVQLKLHMKAHYRHGDI